MSNVNPINLKSGQNLLIKGYNQRKLRHALFLDRYLKLIFPTRHPQSIPSSFQNILVVQSHLIGDLVMATPLLKALKKGYPGAKITLLANKFADEVLKGAWFVDEIVTVNFPWSTYNYSWRNMKEFMRAIIQLRHKKIDLAIDAQIDIRNIILMLLIGAGRRLGYALTGGGALLTDKPEFPAGISNLLEARLSLLQYLGIECDDRTTSLPLGQGSLSYVDRFLREKGIFHKKLIGIHPGASKREKLWPSKNFADVIRYLKGKGFQPVLIEGPNDNKILLEIQQQMDQAILTFKGNLQSVLAFVSRCRLLICLDSAMIHFAGAVGTPALALYGPKWPSLTSPFASNIEILWNEALDCRPCEYGKCKHKTNICMQSIVPEEAIDKINKLLQIKPDEDAISKV